METNTSTNTHIGREATVRNLGRSPARAGTNLLPGREKQDITILNKIPRKLLEEPPLPIGHSRFWGWGRASIMESVLKFQ